MRFIYVSEDELTLFWCRLVEGNKKARVRFIRCNEIIDIRVGCNATDILKQYQVPIEYDDSLLSIITKKRSLDLKASNSEIRNLWVKFLKIIFSENEKKLMTGKGEKEEAKRFKEKEELEEIWEEDIMTHFGDHWDYLFHCPKLASSKANYSSNSSQKSQRSKWQCSFRSIFRRKSRRQSVIDNHGLKPATIESYGKYSSKGFFLD